ncbi:MAG: hypothetical protein SFU85_07360 [Candidatus Methylacidiphilales bacterium]|nr:hypothetical protein [Candidatus Methylacidiphilales bacterium]
MSAEQPTPSNSTKNNLLLAFGGCGLLAVGALAGTFIHGSPRPPGPPPAQAQFHPQPGGPRSMADFQQGRERGERGPGMREHGGPRSEEARQAMSKWSEPLGKIRSKYQGDIAKILRPEQKDKLDQAMDRRESFRKDRPAGGGPGALLDIVLIAPQLDRLATHLVLDEAQKKQVEVLLRKQRDEVLAWVDANPPPKPEGRPHRMAQMEGPAGDDDLSVALAAFLPGPGRPDHP